MSGTLVNHMLYSDDICIISLSSPELRRFLNICDDYCKMHDLIYKHCGLLIIYLGNCKDVKPKYKIFWYTFYNRLLRKRDNSAHKIYSGRQLFLLRWVGLEAISHLIPGFGKLILFIYVR